MAMIRRRPLTCRPHDPGVHGAPDLFDHLVQNKEKESDEEKWEQEPREILRIVPPATLFHSPTAIGRRQIKIELPGSKRLEQSRPVIEEALGDILIGRRH